MMEKNLRPSPVSKKNMDITGQAFAVNPILTISLPIDAERSTLDYLACILDKPSWLSKVTITEA